MKTSPLPSLARLLLGIAPVPREKLQEVESDLMELFNGRIIGHGRPYARRRLYGDIMSLWRVRSNDSPGMARSGSAIFSDAAADLRYGARLFARQPGILFLTIVGLALGLGIATATFSIMNAALLRGGGIADSDRVPGVLRATERGVSTVWSYEEFLHLRGGATSIQVEAVMSDAARVRTAPGEEAARSAGISFVSGGFFHATGGRTVLGRPLQPSDETVGSEPAVVLSHGYWVSTLNSDPAVVGKTIWVGRTAAVVVGVAHRSFVPSGGRVNALWIPMTAYGAVYDPNPGNAAPSMGVEVFGRLADGVTVAQAQAQLSGVAATLPRRTAEDPQLYARLDTRAGLGRVGSSQALTIGGLFATIIALVLILSSANVATVLTATAITREREMGVRGALGASRSRIVRQLVTEGLALGVIGAALGLTFAVWAMPVIAAMVQAPQGSDLTPDLNVYLFLIAATLLVGVAAGLAPAWHGRGADLMTPLKGSGARQDRAAPKRLRSLLVLTQAAASVLLIAMATLFVRATVNAARIDVGFDAAGLYHVTPALGRAAFEKEGTAIRVYWSRALSELRSVPGVAAVSLAEFTPFEGSSRTSSTGSGESRVVTYFNRTRADYFDTVGLRIVQGRAYTPEEVAAGAPVVVISQTVARAWDGASPVGSTLERLMRDRKEVIIGVAEDVITARLHEQNARTIYQPMDPKNEVFGRLLVRVQPGVEGVMPLVTERLRLIDSQADIRVESVQERLRGEVELPRLLATLAGALGGVAVLLCVIGLYGLTASVVGQRTREMGLRVALGAERNDLLRLLMWDSLRPVLIGLAIGTVAALLASRLLVVNFFGVSPNDPLVFAGAALILLAAATLAAFAPTLRAASVDPAFVLRQS